MKALVVLVHYFAAEENPRHASIDGSRRDDRARAVEQVLRGYRGAFGPASTLRFIEKEFHLGPDCGVQVDLRVLTVAGHSLVDDGLRRRLGVSESLASPAHPRMLGFSAYRAFASRADQYDWFVYSEDDLLVRDPQLFDKLAWFNRAFGDSVVLQPNRYEWNDRGRTQKTYIDGNLQPSTVRKLLGYRPNKPFLTARPLGVDTTFQRAPNPHSGFFAITAAQLAHWMAQPHWLDHDTSLISPLESAATLGLAKTFSIYKPYGASSRFLEIEHLDNRFSRRRYPLVRPKTD